MALDAAGLTLGNCKCTDALLLQGSTPRAVNAVYLETAAGCAPSWEMPRPGKVADFEPRIGLKSATKPVFENPGT